MLNKNNAAGTEQTETVNVRPLEKLVAVYAKQFYDVSLRPGKVPE